MNSNQIEAVVFDLDGVVTNSTPLHSQAWKEMFDKFLRQEAERTNAPFREFTHEEDYLAYVDGKPRYIGVKSFLESRGIQLPFGDPQDKPGFDTICALGNYKNELYNQLLDEGKIEIYASTVSFMHELRDAGIPLGLATSSKNAARVLEITGLTDLFQARVDGVTSAKLGLKGKPSPDIFQTACDQLGAAYQNSVVVEDANSGVQAGYRGYFGLVLGVAREDNREELELHGADLVVEDLSEISLNDLRNWFAGEDQKKSWLIDYHRYDPEQEGTRETLCAVGNGYFCTRGALEEVSANLDENYPGTYIAGLYNQLESNIAGRTVTNEDFVNCPNWLPLTFKIGSGDWFEPSKATLHEFHRELDFKTGLLTRSLVVEDQVGFQTQIQSKRFASMADPNLAAISYTITPLNYAEKITIHSEIDGTITNQGVKRYRELSSRHLEPLQESGDGELSLLTVKTNQSEIIIGMAARLRIQSGTESVNPEYRHTTVPGKITTTFEIEARSDSPVTVEKIVSIYSSNLPGIDEPVQAAQEKALGASNFQALFEDSVGVWEGLWDKMDVKIYGDRLVQKMVRLHLYHSLVSYSPHTNQLDAGIPARGLHGEAYRGHVFWDELYVMPFYDFHFQSTARAALMYRYRRLPAARKSAEAEGYQGAQFPWQSGSSGEEETQSLHLNPISGRWGPDYSHYQRHVSLAITYNLWHYYWITRDDDFLVTAGAELFLSICKYWSSLADYDPQTGRYHIKGVLGPDEFHEKYPGSDAEGLQDNFYTNVMAAWTLRHASDILDVLPAESAENLLEELGITEAEIARWNEVSLKLHLPISEDGILEQFQGYFDLKELDWEAYRNKYQDIHRMDRILKSEGKSPNDFKVAKQADTLMLFYNLPEKRVSQLISSMGYQVPADLLEKNLHYYLQRTSHGSTLSRLVHAALAHQTGNYELSWKFYQEALRSDYQDIQGGTTQEGIHLGVMTGSVMFLYKAYAGLNWSDDMLVLSPRLPTGWQGLYLNLTFQGQRYFFEIHPDHVRLKVEGSQERKLEIWGKEITLPPHNWTTIAAEGNKRTER
ncbi:MAG: HAD-IA family hydrolase [Anaerolineales bacterium]